MSRPREPKNLTWPTIRKVAKIALKLTKTLSWDRTREGWLHGVVLGLLEAYAGDMQSEYKVPNGRIDFRHGGNNPDLIELVVRRHGNEQYPNMNVGELAKLCRVPFSKARKRILLILDPSGAKPIQKWRLKEIYRRRNAGRGRFSRNTIRVMYFHPNEEYQFYWSPYKTY